MHSLVRSSVTLDDPPTFASCRWCRIIDNWLASSIHSLYPPFVICEVTDRIMQIFKYGDMFTLGFQWMGLENPSDFIWLSTYTSSSVLNKGLLSSLGWKTSEENLFMLQKYYPSSVASLCRIMSRPRPPHQSAQIIQYRADSSHPLSKTTRNVSKNTVISA